MSQFNDIAYITEILGIEVEVDRETNTIGTKIAIDVTVEIKVSDNFLTCCHLDHDCSLYVKHIVF